jgi:ABC-type transport system involved in multi-copper enzyme maturation permease subunit
MNAPAPSSAVPAAPATPVVPNLAHAFGGVWRLAFRRFLLPGHWLALAGMTAVFALLTLANVRGPSAANHFYGWTAGFYLTFLVPILAFISAGGALREEFKAATVDYVFTRPVPRPAFLLFRFLSHVACAQLDFLLPFAVLWWTGVARHVDGLGAALPLLFFAQVLAIVAFGALGFLCAALTSRYVIVGLVYGAVIELGVGQIPTQISRFSMIHQLRAMLQSRLPHGQADWADTVFVAAHGPALTAGILLVFAAVALGAAAAIFSWREFVGAQDA